MIGTRLDHHIIHTDSNMTTTSWNILYGIYYDNHMVDCLTDTVFFSDLLPERCPTLYKNITDGVVIICQFRQVRNVSSFTNTILTI